ncbi:MAG: Rieske (2Fe-2S) protein [Deltaproteobacteria bacterium]|nr:Rieske (2Fe-2S) protein [Deltaproteobacteria bacterium]
MTERLYTRREILTRIGWGATLGTFGGLAGASVRYVIPNVLYEPPLTFKIGRPEDYPEGIDFIDDKRIFVIRQGNHIKVLSGVCTHLGCPVLWAEERNRFECPCHGSLFNARGQVTAGPAQIPLPWYEVTLTVDGRLLVDESRLVSFERTLSV